MVVRIMVGGNVGASSLIRVGSEHYMLANQEDPLLQSTSDVGQSAMDDAAAAASAGPPAAELALRRLREGPMRDGEWRACRELLRAEREDSLQATSLYGGLREIFGRDGAADSIKCHATLPRWAVPVAEEGVALRVGAEAEGEGGEGRGRGEGGAQGRGPHPHPHPTPDPTPTPDPDPTPTDGLTCFACGLNEFEICSPLVEFPAVERWYDNTSAAPHYAVPTLDEALDALSAADADAPSAPPPPAALEALRGARDAPAEALNGRRLSLFDEYHDLEPRLVDWISVRPAWRAVDLSLAAAGRRRAVRGSLCAHQCCAEQFLRSRQLNLGKWARRRRQGAAARAAFLGLGRTQLLGRDRSGRRYWVFSARRERVFVAPPDGAAGDIVALEGAGQVAALCAALDADSREEARLRVALERIMPEAQYLLDLGDGAAPGARAEAERLGAAVRAAAAAARADAAAAGAAGAAPRFAEGDEVFVCKGEGAERLLWRAAVLARGAVGGAWHYAVAYIGWEGAEEGVLRASDVAHEDALLPTTPRQQLRQAALRRRWAVSDRGGARGRAHALPEELGSLRAQLYVEAPGRACEAVGAPQRLAELRAAVLDGGGAAGRGVGVAKLGLGVLEAALPAAGVREDFWDAEAVAAWRLKLEGARGAEELMECLLLLEAALRHYALDAVVGRAYMAAVPTRDVALTQVTLHGVVLRMMLLDAAVLYDEKEMERDFMEELPPEKAPARAESPVAQTATGRKRGRPPANPEFLDTGKVSQSRPAKRGRPRGSRNRASRR